MSLSADLGRERQGHCSRKGLWDVQPFIITNEKDGLNTAPDVVEGLLHDHPTELRLFHYTINPEARTHAEVMAEVAATKPRGEDGAFCKVEEEPSGDDITARSDRGTSTSYLIGRLKRDAPEIAEALARGEYASTRAAAIAAGQPLPGLPRHLASRTDHRGYPPIPMKRL